MNRYPLTPQDRQLISAATSAINEAYDVKYHHVGCAVRLDTGEIKTAVSMNVYTLQRASICAEPIVLGQLAAKLNHIDIIVAVRSDQATIEGQSNVVNTCGICREFIIEFAPHANVILRDGDELFKVAATELLPARFTKDTLKMEDKS